VQSFSKLHFIVNKFEIGDTFIFSVDHVFNSENSLSAGVEVPGKLRVSSAKWRIFCVLNFSY
jgi:hypothetical protein